METNLLEKPQIFSVLRMVADNPGASTGYIANLHQGEKGRDRTREIRLADLTDAGLIEARQDICKGRSCTRYYLTPRGESFLLIIALIEKL